MLTRGASMPGHVQRPGWDSSRLAKPGEAPREPLRVDRTAEFVREDEIGIDIGGA